jgi:hypothetical protein
MLRPTLAKTFKDPERGERIPISEYRLSSDVYDEDGYAAMAYTYGEKHECHIVGISGFMALGRAYDYLVEKTTDLVLVDVDINNYPEVFVGFFATGLGERFVYDIIAPALQEMFHCDPYITVPENKNSHTAIFLRIHPDTWQEVFCNTPYRGVQKLLGRYGKLLGLLLFEGEVHGQLMEG